MPFVPDSFIGQSPPTPAMENVAVPPGAPVTTTVSTSSVVNAVAGLIVTDEMAPDGGFTWNVQLTRRVFLTRSATARSTRTGPGRNGVSGLYVTDVSEMDALAVTFWPFTRRRTDAGLTPDSLSMKCAAMFGRALANSAPGSG